MSKDSKVTFSLVDDHKLFRKGLITLLEELDQPYHLLFEADNGIDLQEKIAANGLPDLILMDINMSRMDGYQTMDWLQKKHPDAKVLIISMVDSEESIMKMVKLGVKGFLSKDIDLFELKNAIYTILNKGFYYTDYITGKLVHSLQQNDAGNGNTNFSKLLSDKELRFIDLACSDKTYNEIAAEMFLSPKTIDGYRNNVFEKLNVKSRVALALFAVKNGLVTI